MPIPQFVALTKAIEQDALQQVAAMTMAIGAAFDEKTGKRLQQEITRMQKDERPATVATTDRPVAKPRFPGRSVPLKHSKKKGWQLRGVRVSAEQLKKERGGG